MILTPENRIKEYTAKGWWGIDTLYSLFLDACKESGESEALVDAPNRNEFTSGEPRRLTFNQIKTEGALPSYSLEIEIQDVSQKM